MSARLSGAYLLGFAFVGVFAPYFTLYLHDTGVGARDIAMLMAVMQSMRLFGPALWGTWADRGGARRRTIGLSVLGSLCGLSAFMAADGFGGMLLAMVLLSLFWSGTLPLLETVTFAHLGDRAAHYGSIRMWGSAGFLAAVLAVGRLLDIYPATIVPWACWLILLALLPISLALPAAIPRRESHPGVPWSQFRTVLAQPTVTAMLGAGFLMAAAHGALNVFYSIHLSEHGYDASTIGLLWALGVAAEILVLMLMPRLNLGISSHVLFMLCFAAAVLRFSLIGWWVDWIAVVAFAQLLHALSFGAHHGLSVSAVHRWFPGEHAAKGQTLYATGQGAGALTGGLASGFLWAVVGSAWTFTISATLAFAGLLIAKSRLSAHVIGGCPEHLRSRCG